MNTFYLAIDICGILVVGMAIWAVFVSLPWSTRKAALQCYVAMARAVEAREPHLVGQAEQTAQYAVVMAWLSLRLQPARILRLETSALLHTMGKVGVAYALLNSPQSLRSPSERYAVREYVRIGAAMLEQVPSLKECAPAVLYHKEYLDGSGYPFGRFGDDIPYEAQILCVASEFVALTSPRIYRAGLAMTPEQAADYLFEHSDTRYNRRCVELLVRARWLLKLASAFDWRTKKSVADVIHSPELNRAA